ncbi:hypothetical protein V5799_025909 [Amblyomma americanum]|uniref:Uncharacterized protein n=1 Tax=Amblyomma americanum TaxID=6943 RepID=A0AAQ4DK32_AMBAM
MRISADTEPARGVEVVDDHDAVGIKYRNAGHKYGDPRQQYASKGVRRRPYRNGPEWVDDRQKPVHRHEDQCVDAGGGAHDDNVLFDPTPGVSEGPVAERVVTCFERDGEDEQKVGHGEVHDENVGGGTLLTVANHDEDNDGVTN